VKYVVVIISMICTACVSIVNRTVPIVGMSEYQSSKTIKVSFPKGIEIGDKNFIYKALKDTKVLPGMFFDEQLDSPYAPENQIKKFTDFFPIKAENKSQYDLEFQVVFKSYGFFEPYCLLFLTILPCTPPIDWIVGIRVNDHSGKFIKDYVVHESAREIYWLFGILKPNVPDGDIRRDLLRNALSNILVDIHQDGII
jgi:hypothetical protein